MRPSDDPGELSICTLELRKLRELCTNKTGPKKAGLMPASSFLASGSITSFWIQGSMLTFLDMSLLGKRGQRRGRGRWE